MKIKKLLAMGLAAVMTVSMAVPTFAAEVEPEQDTITVYLDVEKTLADKTTDTPEEITYIQDPVKLSLPSGTTVMGALLAAGLKPEYKNRDGVLVPCDEGSAYFDALPGTSTLVNVSALNAGNAYLYNQLEMMRTDYWVPTYDYWVDIGGEDFWQEYAEEAYSFMEGWNATGAVQNEGKLTSRDFNAYSGFMFSINNLLAPEKEYEKYTCQQPLSNGDVVRFQWTNCGGWDMGYDVEILNLNMEPEFVNAIITNVNKDALVKAIAEANAVGETEITEYTTANDLLKNKDYSVATQDACDAAAKALTDKL